MKRFVFYKQLNAMDCGPTCLRMIAKYYGKHYNGDTLRKLAGFSKAGVSLLGISDSAEKIGFRTRGVKITVEQLQEVELPCILHWRKNHFVVLRSISDTAVKIADPANGMIKFTLSQFKDHWASAKNGENNDVGIALLLEPTPFFYEQQSEKEYKVSWQLVLRYLQSSRWQVTQVFIALIITSLLQLLIPFLTQSIVDIGINGQNLNFVMLVLSAQLMLSFSQTIVGFVRSKILLRISNTLNIQILSDFWIKLTRLPLSYFDAHHNGDILQRIKDQKEIQRFLTGTALNTLFSVFNFIIYAVILVIYNVNLFGIFLAGSVAYFIWIKVFLKFRRKVNYETFHLSSNESSASLQLIQGMQEIRLNNAEKQKRWEWENIQANIFKLNYKSLNYNQLQSAGATLIIQVQGIVISFVVAKLVIDNSLTFGAMLAIQYIIGQLNAPIQQWIEFVQSFQDAKISMERLNEVHQMDDEEHKDKLYIKEITGNKNNIQLKNLTFTYPGSDNEPVLKGITLKIPENKVTAIVGSSGSGKTTLLKLLLKVYDKYDGDIRLGMESAFSSEAHGIEFGSVSHQYWRSICGAVLQDGFIFNDSIARNITVGAAEIDYDRLIHSCEIANIHAYIQSLPNGYHTKLGVAGSGLSQGQKQRILIARAVYKSPRYLFFDEATNALDANNEKTIIENLERFFSGRTVVIVAHRLSTVKHADKIVVLDKGKIIEEGTHAELTQVKGKYYELVKNQLELGN